MYVHKCRAGPRSRIGASTDSIESVLRNVFLNIKCWLFLRNTHVSLTQSHASKKISLHMLFKVSLLYRQNRAWNTFWLNHLSIKFGKHCWIKQVEVTAYYLCSVGTNNVWSLVFGFLGMFGKEFGFGDRTRCSESSEFGLRFGWTFQTFDFRSHP